MAIEFSGLLVTAAIAAATAAAVAVVAAARAQAKRQTEKIRVTVPAGQSRRKKASR